MCSVITGDFCLLCSEELVYDKRLVCVLCSVLGLHLFSDKSPVSVLWWGLVIRSLCVITGRVECAL